MQPTDEQRSAMDAIGVQLHRAQEAVLVGAAGTGKTTVLLWLIEELIASGYGVVLGTPTGKAAVRLHQITNRPASTLHRLLYNQVDDDADGLVFGDPGPPCADGEVLIVDEASMVGSRLYADVMAHMPRNGKVVWVGDREQLEPVKDTWGPDLASPTAVLRTVHRQAADNPIIGYATAIREGRAPEWRRQRGREVDLGSRTVRAAPDDDRLVLRRGGVQAAIDWAVPRYRDGVDATVVTFTHRVREQINAGVRSALGFQAPIVSGDRLCCKMNSDSLGIMNGEVLTVGHAERSTRLRRPAWKVWTHERPRPFFVLEEHLNHRGQDVWQLRRQLGRTRWDETRIAYMWHGQCLTVHSSQGSQWDDVAFVVGGAVARAGREDPDFARRLCYTAVTRAARHLTVFDLRSGRSGRRDPDPHRGFESGDDLAWANEGGRK